MAPRVSCAIKKAHKHWAGVYQLDSAPGHQVLKDQPVSVGFFLTVRPSIGGGLGNWLASGGCVRSLVFALSRPSVFCFSLLGSRAAARLAPWFYAGFGAKGCNWRMDTASDRTCTAVI